MEIDYFLDEFKKDYKSVKISSNKILIVDNKYNDAILETIYECNNTGSFTKERGSIIRITNFDDSYLNLVGLYCFLKNRDILFCYPDLRKIISAKSEDEIKQIFEQNFDSDYLNNNIVFNPQNPENGKFNIYTTDSKFSIVYVLNDKSIYIDDNLNKNINILCGEIFKNLYSKKKFEDKIISKLDIGTLGDENILKLFSLYSQGVCLNVNQIENKKNNKYS